jgi:phage-related tail fiber protein
MASEYSRVVAFSGNSNAIQALELPAPSYGTLDRFIITQTSPASNTGNGTFKVYDRRSACIGLTDLNVANSGSIVSISNASGQLTIVFNAPHNLIAGNSFLIKDCDTADYNITYTVASVASTTSVIVSSGITGGSETTGVWQTIPFNPRTSPPTSLVYSGTVTAGTTFQAFDLNRGYENKDNQDINLRSRHTGLWLEFTSASLGDEIMLGWEVAYTCQTNSVD